MNRWCNDGAAPQISQTPWSVCTVTWSSLPADLNGVDVNPVQDTPVATRKEDTYIHFSVEVEIQRHVEKLPKGERKKKKTQEVRVNFRTSWRMLMNVLHKCSCSQELLSSLNSSTTNPRRDLPAQSVLASWKWTKSNLDPSSSNCEFN